MTDYDGIPFCVPMLPRDVLALLDRIAELESIWLGRTEAGNDRT